MMDDLSKRIREVRHELDLTQPELAARVEVSRNTVASWETGNRIPELTHAFQIAIQGDFSLDWLTGRTDERHLNKSRFPSDELVILLGGNRCRLPDPIVRMLEHYLIHEVGVAIPRRGGLRRA